MLFLTIREALEIAGKIPKKSYYLRFDPKNYQPGDVLPPSRKWIDGEVTGKILSGTCAIDAHHRFRQIDLDTMYEGYLYLIKGRVSRKGQDPGEVILKDAIIVRRLTE